MAALLLALACVACAAQALLVSREPESGESVSSPHSLLELTQSQSSRAASKITFPWGKKKKEKSTLTPEEVIQKLNKVPTFALVNGAGKIVPLGNVDGSRDVCWFISAEEAKKLLELASTDYPDEGLHLEVIPLGVAFQYADGWPTKQSEAANGDVPFKLKVRGPRREVEDTEADLRKQLKENNIDPGEWVLPVYSSAQFQAEGIMPLFFSPKDFVECWVEDGRSLDELTGNFKLQGVDLRFLVHQMLNSETLNWGIFEFVTSNEAYDLSSKLLHPERVEASPDLQPGTLIFTFEESVNYKDVMEKVEKLPMTQSTELLEGVGIGIVDVSDLAAAEVELRKIEGVKTVERDDVVGIA